MLKMFNDCRLMWTAQTIPNPVAVQRIAPLQFVEPQTMILFMQAQIHPYNPSIKHIQYSFLIGQILAIV